MRPATFIQDSLKRIDASTAAIAHAIEMGASASERAEQTVTLVISARALIVLARAALRRPTIA